MLVYNKEQHFRGNELFSAYREHILHGRGELLQESLESFYLGNKMLLKLVIYMYYIIKTLSTKP